MQITGYLRDLPDNRDQSFESSSPARAGVPPPESDVLGRSFDISIEQQAESCVGFAITNCLYAAWRHQGAKSAADEGLNLASPLFIWWASRQSHGAQDVNQGTYIRNAIKSLSQLGFCPNEKWDSMYGKDSWEFATKPSRKAFRAAMDQQLTTLEYYRVTGLGNSRVESWKQALSQGHPIIAGIPVTREFQAHRGHGLIQSPPTDAKMVGGHALAFLDYDEDGVKGPNTWGRGWGDNGWFHISWQYITEWAMDQWAFRVPQYFSEQA